MRRSALFIAALCVACSSDDGGRSKDPPVSMLGGTTGGGAGGTTGGGAGGTTGGTPMPISGTTGGTNPTGGVGGAAGTAAGTGVPDLPPLDMRTFNGGDTALNNVGAGTICTRLAQIQCAGEEYCCENPGRDRAACEAAQTSACNEGMVDMVAANSQAGFDAAHAASAFNQLQQMASLCDATVASWGATTAGFIGIFKGTVGPGDDCSPPGLIPDQTEAAVSIASCSGIDANACLPNSGSALDSWTCAPKGGVGLSCLTDLNCEAGLYCPNPALMSDPPRFGLGSCAARLADGTPCGAGNECSSLYCVGGICTAAGQQAAYCLQQQL